jgi:hypothetical protein
LRVSIASIPPGWQRSSGFETSGPDSREFQKLPE